MIKYVLLAVLICVDALLLLTNKRKPQSRKIDETLIMPAIYLDMLDPKSLKACSTYSLPKGQLQSTGMMIARAAEDAQGDILLECIFDETRTVSSRNHAVVAKDEYGFFIQNNHSNDMDLVVGRARESRDEIAIKGGEIIYLGNQPIRFRLPEKKVPDGGLIQKIMRMTKRLLGSLRGFSNNRKNRKNSDGGNW